MSRAILIEGVVHDTYSENRFGGMPWEETLCRRYWTRSRWDGQWTRRPVDCLLCIAKRTP